MVAVTGNTQYATQLDVTRSIRLLNLQLAKQNQQLGSGRIVDGLIGVSQRALELGQLKSELGTIGNYLSGVQTAKNRVDLYAVTMEEIIDIATEAQDTMLKNRDPFFAATSSPISQANVLLDRVGSLLQTKDGELYVNGRLLEEPYLPAGTATFGIDEPLVVPEGQVLVLGDNRQNSSDGRVFGPIDEDSVIGRAFVVMWPPGRIGAL